MMSFWLLSIYLEGCFVSSNAIYRNFQSIRLQSNDKFASLNQNLKVKLSKPIIVFLWCLLLLTCLVKRMCFLSLSALHSFAIVDFFATYLRWLLRCYYDTYFLFISTLLYFFSVVECGNHSFVFTLSNVINSVLDYAFFFAVRYQGLSCLGMCSSCLL